MFLWTVLLTAPPTRPEPGARPSSAKPGSGASREDDAASPSRPRG